MFDLIEKLENIEIKNDTRLAQEDKEYCERQHALYIKVLHHYRNMFDALKTIQQEDNHFYNSVNAENIHYSGSYSRRIYKHEFVKVNQEEFADIIEKTHDRFIDCINNYFKDKYNITINEKSFKHYFKHEKPESPERSYYKWGNVSKQETEQFNKRIEEYKMETDNYLNDIINTELHYNPIVDDIFISLGGFNFEEKVEKEIKENAQKAIKGRWNNKSLYEIKNGKISFEILYSRKCNIWNKYRINTNAPDYNAILRALTYFDSDGFETTIYDKWLHRFSGYELKEEDGIYDNHYANGTKVYYFKYYKNGKFDVTFDSHTNALKFAKEYLGYTA